MTDFYQIEDLDTQANFCEKHLSGIHLNENGAVATRIFFYAVRTKSMNPSIFKRTK